MKTNSLTLFLFFAFFFAFAQNQPDPTIEKWDARWVMHPTVQPQAAAEVLFRKTFELTEKPARFVIHVSADNHYRLFVNGTYITRGPARGDLSHWFYETLDIAPHLSAGTNLIAAEVVNWGPKRSFTQFSQMTSFWMQGQTVKESVVNTSESWKCFENKAHQFKPVDWIFDRNSIAFGLYVCNPNDSVTAQNYPWGWQQKTFNDNDWPNVQWADVAGGRGMQHAGGILFSNGKLLIPRRTGLLEEKKEPLTTIARTEGIEKNADFLKNGKSWTIPANKKVTILIDQTFLTMGYPELTVSGGKSSHIRIGYAETLFKTPKTKGNRNDLTGKRFIGIRDVFMPDGGASRTFKPSYLRAFRFIQLEITTQNEPLTLNSFFNVKCTAPVALKAKFETDNPTLNQLMEMGWRTASLCAQDMLLSDAYYEQMQYVGDSRVHNLAMLTLSGDDRLTRNALIQFDQSRIPEGLTYACYPNPFHLIIPSYSLIYIDQLHDYMLWKDDKEYLKQFESGIGNVLDWFENRMQPNGLLSRIDWWPALAWPKGYKNGVPLQMEKGNNTLYTLHYAYTLMHAAEIYQFTGNTERQKECLARAERIRQAVRKLCYDSNRKLFKESPDFVEYAQITNILAVLSEAVQGDEAKNLMKTVLTDTTLTGKVDLFLHAYLFEAMNKTGLNAAFFNEISEWHTMTKLGMTTFVEVPLEWGEEGQRSECHPWSTAPNIHFFKTVCGIRPTSPGHKTMVIEPELGELKKLKAVYPHPLGNFEMDLVVQKKTLKGTITVPQGMETTFRWKGNTLQLKSGSQTIALKLNE